MDFTQKRGMLPEDLYRITYLEDPQISADGEPVAFVRKWLDRDDDEYRSNIWLVASGGGEPRRLTAGPGRDSHPRWSPDGRWLAFISDRGSDHATSERGPERQAEKAQIWLLPLAGGEATRLTSLKEDVEQFTWSPDSSRMALSARVASDRSLEPSGGDSSSQDTPGGEPQRGEMNAGPRIITSLKYKSNGDGFIYDRRRHIFVLDVGDQTCRQLTDGDFDDGDPAWSPDGTTIAFSSARHPRHEFDSASDIFTVSAQGGEARRLTSTLGPAQAPVYSPDGSLIAYLGHDDPHAGGARNTGVWIVSAGDHPSADPAELSTPYCLTAAFDRTAVGETAPVWSADGSIYFAFADSGSVGLAAVHSAGGAPELVLTGHRALAMWSVDRSGARLAFTASTPVAPAELFLAEVEQSHANDNRPSLAVRERRLTSLNGGWLTEVELPEPLAFTYPSADGAMIEGWLLRPSGFDPARTYPLLLNIHGGPHMYYGWSFFDETQVQAGAGYAVLYVNPRGSQGYGEAFAAACRRDWGGKDFEDIMAGLEHAVARFDFVDTERLGVLGGSYGGFMTSWVVGHTKRFKAAVSERAVNSLVSLFGTSDIGYWFEQFEIGGTPLDALAFYLERSPLTYADRVETPLLILHSENDLRCPIEQAEQFYVAVRLHGRADVALVRFPEETHELSRSGKPSRRVERFAIILDWFDRYLRPAEPVAARSALLTSALGSRT